MTRRDKVFISYRREDSLNMAMRIAEELQRRLPKIDIFLDLEDIESATDWSSKIFTELKSSNALLSLIGESWLASFAHRKSKNDVMLREIEFAFQEKRAILPVLIEEAKMPSQGDMPPSIAQLHKLQALSVKHSTFDPDMQCLAERVRRLVNEYGDVYGNWRLGSEQPEEEIKPASYVGTWETEITVPNGNKMTLEFTIREGTTSVRGYSTLSSEKERRPLTANYFLQANTLGESAVITGIRLEGFIKGAGPIRITIPIDDKKGDIYVGQNEEGWCFWTRIIDRTW